MSYADKSSYRRKGGLIMARPGIYPGHVVSLPSSSQKMTIWSIDRADNSALCLWFNEELGGLPVQWTFSLEILDVDADQPSHSSHIPDFAPYPGGVVKLRSGGPAMTIVEASDDGIQCVWLDSSNNREPLSALFNRGALVAAV